MLGAMPPEAVSIEEARDLGAIIWREGGIVHLCDGDRIHPDVVLIWTLCGRDVPANAAETGDPAQVNCPACLANAV